MREQILFARLGREQEERVPRAGAAGSWSAGAGAVDGQAGCLSQLLA